MMMKFFLGAFGAIAAGTGLAVARANGKNRYYSGPLSDHFDGSVFFNPGGIEPRNFGDLLRWQFGMGDGPGEPRQKWPAAYAHEFAPAKPEQRISGTAMRVTMVGHATLLIQTAGLNMLTDPVWSERASPLRFAGPKRVNPPGIDFDDLPPVDIVLLSHNHYDHMDIATLRRLVLAHDPLIVTPLGNDTIVKNAVPKARTVAFDWNEKNELCGAVIHAEPVHHWSARGMFDRRMALWAAFVVETQAGKIYHIGDTGFHGGTNYRKAAEKHRGFRLALLPFGAYEPRWFMEAQHQNPAEAVDGMRLCKAAHVAGHHWATFQLTNEAIETPRDHLFAAMDRAGIARERFRPMLPGEVWDVPEADRT
jgi:L-ascorbate metabolism protein UlaG (beta-lactamase superfamily)